MEGGVGRELKGNADRGSIHISRIRLTPFMSGESSRRTPLQKKLEAFPQANIGAGYF